MFNAYHLPFLSRIHPHMSCVQSVITV